MGKGKRVRALRADLKEKVKAEAAAKAKKQKLEKIAITVISIIVVVALVGSLIWVNLHDARWKSGSIQRNSVVMETEHYEVNAAMMSYYFYSTFNNALNYNSSAFENAGLNTAAPLRDQVMNEEEGLTWFDYFMSETQTAVSEYLYLAEKAYENNVKLDEENEKSIQDTIDAFATGAATNGYELDVYLSSYFGTGVQEQDVRDCLELAELAQKYKTIYMDGLTYTDEELETHYEDNLEQYRYADYHTYVITAEPVDDEKALAAAKAEADELAACKSAKEFEDWVEAKLRKEKEITEKYTEETLLSDVAGTFIKEAQYKDTDMMEWLFNEAKTGEAKVFDDDAGSYTVIYCDKAPYRLETPTRNIHYIVFNNDTYDGAEGTKAKANEVYETLKKENFSDAAFKKAVSEYSEYIGADETGLFEKVAHDSFGVETNEWLFAEDRKKGDCAVLEGESYYVICHYVDDNIEEWKADCEITMQANDYESAMTTWQKEIVITTHDSGIDDVPDIGD